MRLVLVYDKAAEGLVPATPPEDFPQRQKSPADTTDPAETATTTAQPNPSATTTTQPNPPATTTQSIPSATLYATATEVLAYSSGLPRRPVPKLFSLLGQ